MSHARQKITDEDIQAYLLGEGSADVYAKIQNVDDAAKSSLNADDLKVKKTLEAFRKVDQLFNEAIDQSIGIPPHLSEQIDQALNGSQASAKKNIFERLTKLVQDQFNFGSVFAGGVVGAFATVALLNSAPLFTLGLEPDDFHLSEMIKRKIKVCFIEVSSHGIFQKRVQGIKFKGMVFTNLTHDHIDYHKTFKDYRDTKKEVFDTLNKNSFALINIDDKNGKFMTQNSSARVYTYSIKSKSNFSCRIVEQQLNGMLLNIQNSEIWTKLIGEFNAYNVLAIYSVGKIYEIDSLNLLTNISELNSVNGRLQSFLSNSNVTVIIDYAHTPDAVENVLSTINKIKKSNQNLITVIGCGGDRDKAKRSMIGKICSDLSYKVIFTSDNPRSENPESIIKDIVSGVSNYNNNKILVEIERSKAIEEAKKNSEDGDIVLIAGKGHEDYQILKNKVIKFDDFKIAKKIFNK